MDAAFNHPNPLSFSMHLLHTKKLSYRTSMGRVGRAVVTPTLEPKEGFAGH